VNKTNSNVSGSNTSGGSNCNNAASNNQQYFAKINAMKYEPAANRVSVHLFVANYFDINTLLLS